VKFNQITYGQDADNNRGVKVWEYEFENTKAEKEEIAHCLYSDFKDGVTSGKATVILINPHNEEDMEIEVELEDYIDLLIEKARNDNSLYDDEEVREWLKDFKKVMILDERDSENVIDYLSAMPMRKKYKITIEKIGE